MASKWINSVKWPDRSTLSSPAQVTAAFYAVISYSSVVKMIDTVAVWFICFCAGNKSVVGREHLDRLKDGCILCNMGHSCTEIDLVWTVCVFVHVFIVCYVCACAPVCTYYFDSFLSGESADCRAEVGACEAAGGPCYLAWWQENRAAGWGDNTVIIVVNIIITIYQHWGLCNET